MNIDGTPNIEDIAIASDAGLKFIKAISDIFPGVAIRSKSKAESKVTESIIKDIEKIEASKESLGLGDEAIAFMRQDCIRRHGRYQNFSEVLKIAQRNTTVCSCDSKIDKGWAEEFRCHAEKAYDEEAQAIWAKVLSGELESPGSFSKKTMDILDSMSKKDAESFQKLCENSIGGPYVDSNGTIKTYEPRPFLLPNKNGSSYNAGSLTLEEFKTFESMGLILNDMYDTFRIHPGVAQLFVINGRTYAAINKTTEDTIMSLGPVTFSRWGKELASLCTLGTGFKLLTIVRNSAIAQGLEFDEIDISDFKELHDKKEVMRISEDFINGK